ncbi:acyl-CoA dehydrogenase family protein [Amycolatopsis vastitatis]|uniref:Acyl-CoA dehydrogenase n=1 Tax=Amycolatopsis vastitatis TaxID=1905142 RepID=A0A229SZ76_9PSEU|nr:acyl-CoA dehydrogenase family protein [Amycolatopsis vastitatis]OXM64083.1 acyl-CoA dehydrogenase [Amycolatopsis vastitatis]
MDLSYPPEVQGFREEVRAFIAANVPPDWRGLGALDTEEAKAFVEQWRRVLAEHGYLAPAWPVEYGGGGLDRLRQVVLVEELAAAGLPASGSQDVFGIKMIGNLLLRHGTEEQKRYFLPRIISGEDRWCQGFSEPGAGSDLAALRTRAVLTGGEWVIDGQKVWTSQARSADWIFLLARTDPTAVRHRGITMLLVPLDQPGVDIRPITMITGDTGFNEVFFTGVRTAEANVVGEAGGGWTVAMSLLGLERGDEAATNPIMFRAEIDRLIELARERGVDGDPVVRQRLARCYSRAEIMRHLGNRVLTRWLKGEPTGTEASVSKLYWSEHHRAVTELAMDILGPEAMVPTGRGPLRHYRTDDPGAPNSTASWSTVWLHAVSGTIYAGTSEVQRNILAETALGMPREPRPDRSTR